MIIISKFKKVSISYRNCMIQKHYTIGFNERQYNQLKEESERIGSSMASIIRLSIDRYLKEANQ